MKNVLKILGALLVLGAVLRLLRGGRRFAGGPGCRRRAGYRNAFGARPAPAVPIDDQWFGPATGSPTGATRAVPVS